MSELYGIDISRWQGDVDFDALAANKDLAFVIIRAASGKSTDSMFNRNISGIQRVDIPYGLYFASTALTAEAAKQEAHFAIEICKAYKPQLGAWYDAELNSQLALGKAKATELLTEWLSAVSAAGYRAGYYTNKAWLDKALDRTKLTDYPLWYAAYPGRSGGIADAPKDNQQKLSYPYAQLWQWTSSGRIAGISGNVDCNVWYGALPEKAITPEVPATPERKAVSLAELKAKGYTQLIIDL